MSKPRIIATYGLTGEENALVEAALPADDYQLYNANELKGRDLTDLIVTDATIYIIRAEALDEFGVRLFYTYYGELGATADETVIWIGTIPASLPQTVLSRYESFDALSGELKKVLQTAHDRFEVRWRYCDTHWMYVRLEDTLFELEIDNMLRQKYGSNPAAENYRRLKEERATLLSKHWRRYDPGAQGNY